jgi:hypothetical protein
MAVKAGADCGETDERVRGRDGDRAPGRRGLAFVQDVAETPLWEPELLEVRRTRAGALGVGATMISAGDAPSAACAGVAENKQFAAAARRPFYLRVGQMAEPAGAGARLTFHYRGGSRGFFKLAEPLVVRLTERALTVNADLRLGHARWVDGAVTGHLWPGVRARSGRPLGPSGRVPA